MKKKKKKNSTKHVQDFMAVLITCKSDEDSIKDEIAITRTFSDQWGPQGWVTLMPIVESGPKLNLSEILCRSLLSAIFMKIQSRMNAIVRQHFSNYISMGD